MEDGSASAAAGGAWRGAAGLSPNTGEERGWGPTRLGLPALLDTRLPGILSAALPAPRRVGFHHASPEPEFRFLGFHTPFLLLFIFILELSLIALYACSFGDVRTQSSLPPGPRTLCRPAGSAPTSARLPPGLQRCGSSPTWRGLESLESVWLRE